MATTRAGEHETLDFTPAQVFSRFTDSENTKITQHMLKNVNHQNVEVGHNIMWKIP